MLLSTLASLMLGTTYYIDPKGSDEATGTSAQTAFATIGRAAALMKPGDTCQIGSGAYRETVVPAHSGTAEAPVVFRGAPGATVTIDGADRVVGWQSVGDGLFEADLPASFHSVFNQADQLFFDGRVPSYARWPDRGEDPSRPRKATLKRFVSKSRDAARRMTTVVFEDDDLKTLRPADVVGSTIVVQPNSLAWSWILVGQVVALDGARLTLETRSDSGKDGEQSVYAVGSRYFLMGKSWMADGPGEWWVDRSAGKVHLRLASGDTPAKHEIEMKARDFAFDLTGRSHVTVQGLKMVGCTVTTDAQAGGDGVPYEPDGRERYPWRPKGFVAPSEGVRLLDLDVRYPNSITDVSGHFFFQWGGNTGLVLAGKDHLVQGCRVQYADGNGISLNGRGHRCLNNTLLDADLIATDCAGIATGPYGTAQDIEIGYNTVQRTGRSGIVLRDWENSDVNAPKARMHHNLVEDYLLQDWDGGGFYVIGHDGKFARIDHNVFRLHDPKLEGLVFGLYFDYSKNYIADHNVSTGAVTAIQVTREFDPDGAKINNLLIYNNTAIPNGAAWGRPFYADSNRGSLVMNNLFKVNVFPNPNGPGNVNHWPTYGSAAGLGATQIEGNVVWGDDPQGYNKRDDSLHAADTSGDPGLGPDMRPAPGSPAPAGVRIVPTITRDGIALRPFDSPKGAAYVGAYAPGEPAWTVGAEAFGKRAAPRPVSKANSRKGTRR
ncbi:hypothetical protein BH11ARM2_BH11ARM2_18760 [soil metagenome]